MVLNKEGYVPEQNVRLDDGRVVRKDAVKGKEAVTIKPSTESGIRCGDKREKLMQENGWRTRRINYDPKNPAYQEGSPKPKNYFTVLNYED